MSSNTTKDQAKDAVDDVANSGKADQAKGHAKEVAGSVRAKVGSFVGSEEMEAKGRVQEAEGKADRLKGEVKE
ncbi:MAG: CsbD family protein, partial [Gammaproteobacteria bacterium]|nr:CsbD family protein [Gammaproteobacteria bacterium]